MPEERVRNRVDGHYLNLPEYFDNPVLELDAKRNSTDRIKILQADIENYDHQIIVPSSVQTQLSRVSQLGLKEVWLQRPAAEHNRWKHSVGTYNAGYIWLSLLEQDGRVPEELLRVPLDNWQKIRSVVGTALVLHDFGHLPFSHLFNDVLDSINWLSSEFEVSEDAVLHSRLSDRELETPQAFTELMLRDSLNEGNLITDSANVSDLIRTLILGGYGVPWLQTIVNSPIDADKIDYLRYDSWLLEQTKYPIRPRLLTGHPGQWLTEFLSDQEVNDHGLFALHGRSARAAAELWEERIYLYDRFYLSPEMRVPERMGFEIIQQYLIRCTMSQPFLETQDLPDSQAFVDTATHDWNHEALDPIEAKFQSVLSVIRPVGNRGGGQSLEFMLIKAMMEEGIEKHEGFDQTYRDFLMSCYRCLERLQHPNSPESVATLMKKSLVKQPLLVPREEFVKVRNLLRPLQHQYCREALIDIARMPRVLSAPRRFKTAFRSQERTDVDFQVLVPSSPMSSWGPGQVASRPLRDDTVEELEKPYAFCRIIVICPDSADSAKAAYVWDRVRSRLLEESINVQLATETTS